MPTTRFRLAPLLAIWLIAAAAAASRAEEEEAGEDADPPGIEAPAPDAPKPGARAPYAAPQRAKAAPRVERGAPAAQGHVVEQAESPALGGAGVSQGAADKAARPVQKMDAGGSASSGGAPAGCLVENVDWHPGCGALNAQGASQALRPHPAGKTIAYRITASQLGPSGSILIPDNVPPNYEMWLSNAACGAAAAAGACRKKGTEIAYYDPKTLTPEQLKRIKSDPSYASSVCLLPAPAGAASGQSFWYLNVRALGEGGRRMVCWTPALKAGSTAVSYDGKHRYEAGSNPWR